MKRRALLVLAILLSAGTALYAAANVEEQSSREALSFSMMKSRNVSQTSNPMGPAEEERIIRALEAYMGIDIDIEWIYRDQEDVDWSTFFASMDWEDAFFHWDNDQIKKLGEDGLLVNIRDYEAPYYSIAVKDNFNETLVTAADGGIYNFSYGFFTAPTEAGSTQWTWVWRMDLFQKHGLAIPKTLEELYRVSKRFKELYPDSYPMGSYIGAPVYSNLRVLLNINKTAQSIFYNGKEYVFGPTHDEEIVKETLRYLNRFYEEGLLDPEYLTQTGDQSRAKSVDGTYVYVPDHFAGNIKTFNSNEAWEDVEYGFAVNPVGFDGTPGWKISSNKPRAEFFGYGVALNADYDQPELLVKFFDYFYSAEMRQILDYGDQGVHYDVVDGKIQVRPFTLEGATNWDTRKGVIKFDCGLNDGWGTSNLVYEPELCYVDGRYFRASWLSFTNQYYGPETVYPNESVPNVILSEDDRDLHDTLMGPINTYVDEIFNKLIMGDLSFDQWDSFMEKVRGMGDIQSVLNMMNRNLDRIYGN